MAKHIAKHNHGSNFRGAAHHAGVMIRGGWNVRLRLERGDWSVYIYPFVLEA